MRILIDDGMQIKVGTGIGKYTKYLYTYMKESKLFKSVDLVNYENIFSKPCNKKMMRIKYLMYINSKKYFEKMKDYDYVWFTNYIIPFRKPKNTKIIVTIHDLVSFLYPNTLPLLYRFYIRFFIKYAVKKSDIIFTVSNSSKNEIQNLFKKYSNKVKYFWPGIYDGISSDKIEDNFENHELNKLDNQKYFLYVGTVEKRKNIDFIIEAFIELKKNNEKAKGYKFVIAGRPGFGYKEFINKINYLGYSNDFIFPGYVSDLDSNKLYCEAKAFVFPSVYEGFGSNQIECMKCKLPILLSDIPTNREISREYGLFFSLNDTNTLVEQMNKIVENNYDYAEKEQIATKYLKEFEWNLIIKDIYKVLKTEE